MNYRAAKIPVSCDETVIRQWVHDLTICPQTLKTALQREGVRHEVWYLGREHGKPFLIGVMDCDNHERAVQIFLESEHDIDRIHRAFTTHWLMDDIEQLDVSPQHEPRYPQYEKLFEAFA